MDSNEWPIVIGDKAYLVDRTVGGTPAVYEAQDAFVRLTLDLRLEPDQVVILARKVQPRQAPE